MKKPTKKSNSKKRTVSKISRKRSNRNAESKRDKGFVNEQKEIFRNIEKEKKLKALYELFKKQADERAEKEKETEKVETEKTTVKKTKKKVVKKDE